MKNLNTRKITNSKVEVLLPNKTVVKIELPREIEAMSSNLQLGQIVICSSSSNKSDIRIYDIFSELIFKINSPKFIHCAWDSINKKIFFSDGNILYNLKEGEEKFKEILKFSRYKYDTSNFSISPNSRYIGFFKFRAGYNRLHLIDLETNELVDVKLICNHYVWIDHNTVIYSTIHGKIGYYNINERKKTSIKINIKSILKSKSSSMLDLQNSIAQLEEYEKDWIKFLYPIKIKESIYFIIEGKSLFNTALVKFCNSEYELLFQTEDNVMWYALDDDTDIIANADNVLKSYLKATYNIQYKEDKTRHYYLNKNYYSSQSFKF